jgi:glycosyltransferase involved in cell wall biosynthesis
VGLRVVHTPLNIAGIPWTNVQALRRKGVDAKLVVVERQRLHPEADVDLARPKSLWRRLPLEASAFFRLLPQTDIFHFYGGYTLLPRTVQVPALRLARRKFVYHFLGSDIRGRTREELAYGERADAQIVGSYDAIRWVPDAEVIPPGVELSTFTVPPPSEHERPIVVHAPSNRRRKGTEHVIEACRQLGLELDLVEGLRHDEARRRYERADIVVDQLNAGWYGVFAIEAMALGKPVLTFLLDEAVERTEQAFGVRVPIVRTSKETLTDDLRALAESPERRRAVGAASRRYVEAVHDLDVVTDRLIDLYRRL